MNSIDSVANVAWFFDNDVAVKTVLESNVNTHRFHLEQ